MAFIKSWSEEQGFGYIDHPEHGELLFDFEGCDFLPALGDEVEVLEVTTRSDGSLKAMAVRCPAKPHQTEAPPPLNLP